MLMQRFWYFLFFYGQFELKPRGFLRCASCVSDDGAERVMLTSWKLLECVMGVGALSSIYQQLLLHLL